MNRGTPIQISNSTFEVVKFEDTINGNRGLILLLLDKVEESGDKKYVPLLEA